jgi:hypothetical protein
MNATLTFGSVDSVQQVFASACSELSRARWSQALKDTPAARLQVELCRARVDAILDDWNDARGAPC